MSTSSGRFGLVDADPPATAGERGPQCIAFGFVADDAANFRELKNENPEAEATFAQTAQDPCGHHETMESVADAEGLPQSRARRLVAAAKESVALGEVVDNIHALMRNADDVDATVANHIENHVRALSKAKVTGPHIRPVPA